MTIAGFSHGGPSISFGASMEDRMLTAASRGLLESSVDEQLAVLPPSGRVALLESDPEHTAMLSRTAMSV